YLGESVARLPYLRKHIVGVADKGANRRNDWDIGVKDIEQEAIRRRPFRIALRRNAMHFDQSLARGQGNIDYFFKSNQEDKFRWSIVRWRMPVINDVLS